MDLKVATRARRRQSPRDGRPAGEDEASRPVTSGAPGGTDGWGAWVQVGLGRADPRNLKAVLLVAAPLTALVCAVNALTTLADVPDVGAWKAWSLEATSGVMILTVIVAPWLATALAPPDEAAATGWRPKARFLATHLAGLLIFSAVHVAGFVLLRRLVFEWMGAAPYWFDDRFVYELRKDLLSYAGLVSAFWLITYLRRRRDEPARTARFDIRDGARIIRTPVSAIVAINSAGNYVEFWLSDGRRPLMRTTLAAVELDLASLGFARTHRSWLVNAEQVTGLRPEGSGDWMVELGTVEAPLSRRYPQALERLRSKSARQVRP